MPYYKSPDNRVHWIESEEFTSLLPVGSAAITDEEAASLSNPPKSHDAMWQEIKAERDRRKAGGVKVTIGGVDKWFHSDDPSRIQQLGLVMMGANIPANLEWKTMDGTFVTMTQTLAAQVFQAVAAYDVAVFGAAEAHRLAMEESQTPSDYDYSAGWPETYAEWSAVQ
jgi:hypothetical protein